MEIYKGVQYFKEPLNKRLSGTPNNSKSNTGSTQRRLLMRQSNTKYRLKALTTRQADAQQYANEFSEDRERTNKRMQKLSISNRYDENKKSKERPYGRSVDISFKLDGEGSGMAVYKTERLRTATAGGQEQAYSIVDNVSCGHSPFCSHLLQSNEKSSTSSCMKTSPSCTSYASSRTVSRTGTRFLRKSNRPTC